MKQVSLYYDASKIEPLVDELIPHVQAQNEGITISRSKVMILCLLDGLRRYRKHFKLEPAGD